MYQKADSKFLAIDKTEQMCYYAIKEFRFGNVRERSCVMDDDTRTEKLGKLLDIFLELPKEIQDQMLSEIISLANQEV